MLLPAPRDETASTNAGTSELLHETDDASAHQNSAEHTCIWLAMVRSVSPGTEHAPAKAMTVSPESSTAPVGGGGAWPGFEHHQYTRCRRCGGRRRVRRARLPCPWAVAGPGRASRRRAERSSRRGRLAGGPPPTGTLSSPAQRAAAHGHTEQPGPTAGPPAPGTPAARRSDNSPGHTKTDIRIGCRSVVELGGFEPPTFSLRTRRATNCAIAPRTHTA